MDDKGYSFKTQEKLKDCCQKNRINLDLVEYRQTVDHDQILEMINYCSLGDYDHSVALALEVRRFRSNPLMFNSRSHEFLKYFLRTNFISVQKYLECDKSNELRVFRGSLDAILQHARGIYDDNQGIFAIDEYMKTQCERYKEESIGILEEMKTLKKQL